jgi:type IV pilus assembly protein PilA
MIEMLVVVAIVAILALMAVPALQERIVRDQVAAAAPLADVAKPPIAAAWAATQTFPPPRDCRSPIDRSATTSARRRRQRAIHMTFGNSAGAR